MKSTRILSKILSGALLFSLLCTFFVSCKKQENSNSGGDFVLDGYKIVRAAGEDDVAAEYTAKLKNAIAEKTGASLSVITDDVSEASEKEILIGKTNRSASNDGLQYLKTKTSGDAYLIQINENNIVILGTTEMATVRAIKVFIEKYVNVSNKESGLNLSAGNMIAGAYNSKNIIVAANNTELEIEVSTSVFSVPESGYDSKTFPYVYEVSNVSYPSVIKLAHQQDEADNGKLICVFYLDADPIGVGETPTGACVMMSDDDGKTWKFISRPEEEIDTSLSAGQMAHIYELPEDVGDMPAGTLIYAANSVDFRSKTNISFWRSTDCGKSWQQYVCIATGGGDREGVWEPFVIYGENDGYLYCFYSDDRGSAQSESHDQSVVFVRSKDGVNWEDPIEVVAHGDSTARAGMPVITKMGNGEYFMVYELVHKFDGSWGAPIFYKTTKDLSSWGDPSNPGVRIEYGANGFIESGPACVWTPDGGPNGTLIVTSRYGCEDKILLSFDYGKSWEQVENPLSFTPEKNYDDSRMGYSAGLWVDEDGTVYYVNCINAKYDSEKRQIAFARIKIY